MTSENQTQALIRQLGGASKICRLLADQDIDITRQAVSQWGKADRIGPAYLMPVILLCQSGKVAGWSEHPDLNAAYRLAWMVLKNERDQRAA